MAKALSDRSLRAGRLRLPLARTYSIFDRLIESTLEFPDLETVAGPGDRIRVVPATAAECAGETGWFNSWVDPAEQATVLFGRRGSDYVVRAPEVGDFYLNAAADCIAVRSESGIYGKSVRHFLLDQMVPLAIAHTGSVVLHGSAVATPAGGLAFVGRSGVGKSTLAGGFARLGLAVLTDDAVLIKSESDELTVIPSYPGLRLWPDVIAAWKTVARSRVNDYSEKRRLDSSSVRFSRKPARLRALYFIAEPTGQVSINRMSSRDALIELVRSQFILDCKSTDQLRAQFVRASRLVTAIPAFRLCYPHSLGALPAVVEAILSHAA